MDTKDGRELSYCLPGLDPFLEKCLEEAGEHSQRGCLDRALRQIRLLLLPSVQGAKPEKGRAGESVHPAPAQPESQAGFDGSSARSDRGQPSVQEVDGCEADGTIEAEAQNAGCAPPADTGQVPLGSVF